MIDLKDESSIKRDERPKKREVNNFREKRMFKAILREVVSMEGKVFPSRLFVDMKSILE